MAASAQSTSSTNTTVGVVRAYPSTRLVSASSVRVRSRSITSGSSAVDGSSASARTRSSTSRPGRRAGGVGDGDEERVAQRQVGEIEVVVAPTPEHRRPPAAGVVERLLREAGLADARLALDDHQVTEAAEGDVDAGANQLSSARRPINGLDTGRA